MLKRIISFLLALVICLTCLPDVRLQVRANDDEVPTEPPIEATTAPTEVPTEPPTEATTAPTEMPTEGTTVPAPSEYETWTVPYKTYYIVNQETLDTTGCTLTIHHSDGSQEVYDITPAMVAGFDNTVLGPQTLVATCLGYELWFEVVIIEEPKPQHINFNGWEIRNTYYQGEPLDLTDGVVQVYYDNGSRKDIPATDPSVTVSGYDPNLLGIQSLTVSCMGLTTDFQVTVYTYSGQCGDDLQFSFDEVTGTLTVTGSGAMYDFDWNMVPWRAYADRILKVELPSGLTTLGTHAFGGCYNMNEINLPQGLERIGDHALEECHALTSLTIPDSVKYIGVYALSGAGVYTLTLPEGLETVDMYAFMSCYNLRTVELPQSLKTLGGGAFQYCINLETADLPETLDTVSWHTFNECTSLKEITIPQSVTEISYFAFNSCTDLKYVEFEGSAPGVDAGPMEELCPFNNVTSDAWYPGGDTTWTAAVMDSMGGNLNWMEAYGESCRVTLEPNGGVIAEGEITRYFPGTPVELPAAVFQVGASFAGWYDNDTNAKVTEIPADATGDKIYYARWNHKPSVNFDETVRVFQYDGTGKEYVLKDSGGNVLPVIQGTDWLLPCSYTQVLSAFGQRDNAETGASTFHQGIDLAAPLGTPVFAARSGVVTTAVYSDSAGNYVNIDHQDGYFSVYMHLCAYTVKAGQYVSQGDLIGFAGNTGIASDYHLHFGIRADNEYVDPAEYVDLENGATAFLIDYTWSGSALNEDGLPCEPGSYSIRVLRPETEQYRAVSLMIDPAIIIKTSDVPTGGTCGDNLTWHFEETTGTLTISENGRMEYFDEWYDDQGNKYTSAPWYDLREQILSVVIKEGVANIGGHAFDGCLNLQTITIPATVTEIGGCAFEGCTSLQTISVAADNQAFCTQNGVLFSKDMTALIKYPARKQNTLYIVPDSVTEIWGWAFEGNAWLKRITLPEGMAHLEEGTFNGCSALTEITIPESVNWTSPVVFENCTSLTKVVLPGTITWLGEGMFAGCTSLKTVVMPDKIEGIATGAFAGCTALEEITLPEGLQCLWTGAFRDCYSLKSITIPSTANHSADSVMMDHVFADCTSLEWVIFNGPAPAFGDNAFIGVTATAVYPGNDVTWTADKKQNYGGNLTWKPMVTKMELYLGDAPALAGETFSVTLQKNPAHGAADLTVTVTGAAELVSVEENELILRGKSAGIAAVTATDAITGVTAEVSIPVQKAIVLTCPGVSDPFDLSFESKPIFTFTPTETKQYSLVLENVENPVAGYGAVATIDVVNKVTNTDVMCDAFFWEETSSQGFYTLEQGVTYQITPQYIGEDTIENVTLRISDVAEVTGIEIPMDAMTCYYDASGIIDLITIEAFFRPVQALGDITWSSSDPSVLEFVLESENRAEFAGRQYGTAVVTATCGGYSDSVTVTVKEPAPLHLNTPVKEVLDNYPREAYSFTTEEAGWYRFTVTADIAMHLSGLFDTYSFDAEGRLVTKLRANEAYILFVDGMEADCHGAEYTLLAEKLNVPTGMTLEPTLAESGRLEVRVVYTPADSMERIETVEWDNANVVQSTGEHDTTAYAKIVGVGETTVTIATENGLMAARTLAVGSCGQNLFWMFDKVSGTLTIAGTGAMYNYSWEGAPWKPYADQILAVELPDTLTALGAYAFDGCINLKELQLPEGIPSIPDYALNRCMSLSSLTIPDSVKTIGDTALSECNGLTALELPEGLEIIEGGAFYWANGLQEVVLPESLTSLGGTAFLGCTALEKVNIPESLSIINWGTFNGCTSLKEITIPKSITQIAYHAFIDCTGLENVIFEGSAPSNIEGMNDPFWAPFKSVTAAAWYPAGDASWTEEAMIRLGREMSWFPNGPVRNSIVMEAADFGYAESVWIDGREYPVEYKRNIGMIDLPDSNAKTMIAYTYHVGDPDDIHTQYPVSMKVWTLTNEDGFYTVHRQQQLDDILQYSGMSIRVYGKKGIRMITSIEQAKKNALTGAGLAGYTLKEYGTVLAWADQISRTNPLVLGKYYTRSNYAYKKGVADPVFNVTGDLMQYTNVLVNFTNAQCKNDIAMRPYIILEDGSGQQITLYGGIVQRSIGYIAYQNRNVFEPGTEEYEYVWDIIRYVYGTLYDDEYRTAWTPPAM